MNWKQVLFLLVLAAIVASGFWLTSGHSGKKYDRAAELRRAYEKDMYDEYKQGFSLKAGTVITGWRVPAGATYYPRILVHSDFPVSVAFIPEDLKGAAGQQQTEDSFGKCTEHGVKVTAVSCKLDPGESWIFSVRDERNPDPEIIMPGVVKSPDNVIHLIYQGVFPKKN